MSRAEESFKAFEKVVAEWRTALDDYTPEQFALKPSAEEWSIGQVYAHLLQTAHFMQLRNAGECLAGNGARSATGHNANGEGVFAANAFPPIQIKVPASPGYTPRQPEGIEGLREELDALTETMRSFAGRIAGFDPEVRLSHPGLGLLNAEEWYLMVEMHFRHHLHQKRRLDAWLAVGEAVAA